MTKRKGKPVSFDAMVKFFIHNYGIPTKRDVDRIVERLDRLEKLIKTSPQRSRRAAAKNDPASPTSATDRVLDLIKHTRNGVTITQIREQTGYDDKKLRNIIYRLNQMGKITRISRGSYKVSD